ncbi:hypothetical protein HMPREF9151_02484 [Hoylesella saccharolytica F0055]|uniref:Uncharacterized protein n=1 Tax=Hoylesella saccharolytica F0055 TaxID=1127699 RepID=L1MYT2_9BACT|nr:hypothetical protein HMPREF9151_02484 [Hoylesella saccharolytica F0055]
MVKGSKLPIKSPVLICCSREGLTAQYRLFIAKIRYFFYTNKFRFAFLDAAFCKDVVSGCKLFCSVFQVFIMFFFILSLFVLASYIIPFKSNRFVLL